MAGIGQFGITDGKVGECSLSMEHVFVEHTAVCQAILDRNPEQASELMRAHIPGSRSRLFAPRKSL